MTLAPSPTRTTLAAGLPAPVGDAGRAAAREGERRGQLRLILFAWVFGACWSSTIGGAALARFQLGIGTPDWAFGVLAAMPFAAGLFQIPASLFQTLYGRRKAIFMATATFGRLMWVFAA